VEQNQSNTEYPSPSDSTYTGWRSFRRLACAIPPYCTSRRCTSTSCRWKVERVGFQDGGIGQWRGSSVTGTENDRIFLPAGAYAPRLEKEVVIAKGE
jgi:hypothetical protein